MQPIKNHSTLQPGTKEQYQTKFQATAQCQSPPLLTTHMILLPYFLPDLQSDWPPVYCRLSAQQQALSWVKELLLLPELSTRSTSSWNTGRSSPWGCELGRRVRRRATPQPSAWSECSEMGLMCPWAGLRQCLRWQLPREGQIPCLPESVHDQMHPPANACLHEHSESETENFMQFCCLLWVIWKRCPETTRLCRVF